MSKDMGGKMARQKGVAVYKKSYILNLKYTNFSFHERLNDNVLKCAKIRNVL